MAELFSPSRGNAHVLRTPDDGGTHSIIFDLVVDKVSGEVRDFSQTNFCRNCWTKAEDPWVVIGSLPCTAFSVLNDGLNCHRIETESQGRKMAEARVTLGFPRSVCTCGKHHGYDASFTSTQHARHHGN